MSTKNSVGDEQNKNYGVVQFITCVFSFCVQKKKGSYLIYLWFVILLKYLMKFGGKVRGFFYFTHKTITL